MLNFKRLARKTARRLGYDITRYSEDRDFDFIFSRALVRHKVDLILDVGANTGQFAAGIRNAGYTEQIISFEPMSVEYTQLLHLSSHDSKWDVAPRMAIGDTDGEVEINIAGNSGSSSILSMLDLHRQAAPESAYSSKEAVEIRKLDTLTEQIISPKYENIFLKIDVQGYECAVLEGAKETLSRVVGIFCECSFVPLYEGEANWISLVEKIEKMGFGVWGIVPGFSELGTGRVLQADFLFFRES
jgi:FkbM family methyltransferase